MAIQFFPFFSRKPISGNPDFEDNPSPKLIFDRETLKILLLNKAAIKLYGYTKDELQVMTIRKYGRFGNCKN